MKDVLGEIIECRHAIRLHRDAKGDDRCWLDDYKIWALAPGSFPTPTEVPEMEQAMDMCRAFYKLRRSAVADAVPQDAVVDRQHWDDDLEKMSEEQLAEELVRVRAALRRHRDSAGNPLTIGEDRELYAVLPEKLPADFRLPPEDEFLGEKLAPRAGCPSFWRSHAHCGVKRHNLHQWGPCHGKPEV